MSSTYVDCPVCGHESKVEEENLTVPIECPKCKKSFTVDVGESYGVDDLLPPRPSRAPSSPGPRSSAPAEPDPEDSESDDPDAPTGKSWLEAWPKD
ncbi:hypothetical protein P12x_002362 [Tundrisphaera lichenicola]|uniref:hypothetical protein n=1 Tax=Tundrisphaera lichenicola TaxID=2029860 RepID=UPI003EB9814B